MESEVSIIMEGNFYSRQRKANTILFKPGYSLAVKMMPISIITNRLFSSLYILSRVVKMLIFMYISNDICLDIDASMSFDVKIIELNIDVDSYYNEVSVRQQKFIHLESSACSSGANYMMDQHRQSLKMMLMLIIIIR